MIHSLCMSNTVVALIKSNICQSFSSRFKFVRPRRGSLPLADVAHFVVPWGQAKVNFIKKKNRTHNFSGPKISYGPRSFSGPNFFFEPKKNQKLKKVMCTQTYSGPTFLELLNFTSSKKSGT